MRSKSLIGESNWNNPISKLNGAVLGLRINSAFPEQTLDLPQITGAVTIEVIVRMDDLDVTADQRLFDFADEGHRNDIFLAQVGTTNKLRFMTRKNGVASSIDAGGALVVGEEAKFTATIMEDGKMILSKNGEVLVEGQGEVPSSVARKSYIGLSSRDYASIHGVVMGVTVTNAGSAVDNKYVSVRSPIFGAFTGEAYVRFDDIAGRGWQRVIDFGQGAGRFNVFLSQEWTSRNIKLAILQNGIFKSIRAVGVIDQNVFTHWRFGVDENANMFIEKDGVRVAEGAGQVPVNIERFNSYIGRSNWGNDSPLQGCVLGLKLESEMPDQDIPSLPDITGAFKVTVTARFDNVGGKSSQQGMFHVADARDMDDSTWLLRLKLFRISTSVCIRWP